MLYVWQLIVSFRWTDLLKKRQYAYMVLYVHTYDTIVYSKICKLQNNRLQKLENSYTLGTKSNIKKKCNTLHIQIISINMRKYLKIKLI